MGQHEQEVNVWNTGLHVTIGTGNVTEDMRGTVLRDMSELFGCCGVFEVLTVKYVSSDRRRDRDRSRSPGRGRRY